MGGSSMAYMSFYSWINNLNLTDDNLQLIDQIKFWDHKKELIVGYADDIKSIHLYYKGFAFLHLSFKDRIYIINRLTNSANNHCSKVVKLKITKQVTDLYTNIDSRELYNTLNKFTAKVLTKYDIPTLLYFIKTIIKKIDTYYILADEKFKNKENNFNESLGAIEILLNDDFYVTELSTMLDDFNNLYEIANDILQIIDFFQQYSKPDFSISKEIAISLAPSDPNIDLMLLQINLSSDRGLLLGGAASITSIIKDIATISKINSEKELNRIKIENEIDNKIYETKQKYVKLLQQIEECNHPAGKAMLQQELKRCLEIIHKYDKSIQAINVIV